MVGGRAVSLSPAFVGRPHIDGNSAVTDQPDRRAENISQI